jgi:uncharacterized protein YlxW (UPF0749 family)
VTTTPEPEQPEPDPAGSDQPTPLEPESTPAVSTGRRMSAGGAVISLLLGLLGFALVVQLRSNTTDAALTSARPEDLVRILSDLDSRQERLRQDIADLEETRRQLESGAQGREAALTQAHRRADDLGILAGTLPAIGPGLDIRLIPGAEPIHAVTVLDAVEELRGAGAEAMQLSGSNGAVIRVVASSYFVDATDALTVDGQRLTAPYGVLVIGDPQTMQTALNIPGGVVDALRQHGGTVSVREDPAIRVDALHKAATLRYARPVS